MKDVGENKQRALVKTAAARNQETDVELAVVCTFGFCVAYPRIPGVFFSASMILHEFLDIMGTEK